MIPTPILRRLFSTLAIIAITGLSTGLYYKNDAYEHRSKASSFQPMAEESFQKCKREQSDCALFDTTQLEIDFQEIAKKSDAVAFWWFLAGWLSVAVIVGYPVSAWIVTGSPFGTKRNLTTE